MSRYDEALAEPLVVPGIKRHHDGFRNCLS